MIRLATANLDWAHNGDRDYVHWLTEHADVLLLQEAKNVHLGRVLPSGWASLQQRHSEAAMGSCIAFRRDAVRLGRHGLTVGVTPQFHGERVKMLTRHIAWATFQHHDGGRVFTPISGHFPPRRFHELQPIFERRLADVMHAHPRPIVGTDANQPIHELARRLHAHAYGHGIVGFLSPEKLHEVQLRPYGENHGATDHPAVIAEHR